MFEIRNKLMQKLDGIDTLSLFLVGFILAYAAASLFVEYSLGIVGFAKAPYLNGFTYLYMLGFIGLGVILNRATLRFVTPHPYAMMFAASIFASAAIGISNANAAPYIAAWTLYMASAILAFQFFRNPDGNLSAEGAIRSVFSRPMLLAVLVFAFDSIYKKDNDYQYSLFEVMAIYATLFRPKWTDKALGLVIFALVHLGTQNPKIGVAIELNRASILAIGTVGLLYLIYRRYFMAILASIGVAIIVLSFAVSLGDDTLRVFPRNVREAIMIMKGDPVSNHPSSYQRLYENQKVLEDYDAASTEEWVFGRGLGRTLDMTEAKDTTPGRHALLGATKVHNIHFLHYAVFHKFGLTGLALLATLAGWLIWMFGSDLVSKRLTDATMFLYLYLFYNFVFAVPASNFLIANPLWPAFLGALCWIRAQHRHPIATENAGRATASV